MRIALISILIFLFGSSYGQEYYIYVTAESEDQVSLVKFDGEKLEAVKTIQVGFKPSGPVCRITSANVFREFPYTFDM